MSNYQTQKNGVDSSDFPERPLMGLDQWLGLMCCVRPQGFRSLPSPFLAIVAGLCRKKGERNDRIKNPGGDRWGTQNLSGIMLPRCELMTRPSDGHNAVKYLKGIVRITGISRCRDHWHRRSIDPPRKPKRPTIIGSARNKDSERLEK